MEKNLTMAYLSELFLGSEEDITGKFLVIWGQIKLTNLLVKNRNSYKWEPFKEDFELGSSVYPLVLVQVPMFNEREVYPLFILLFLFKVQCSSSKAKKGVYVRGI
ncbi:hypothetical protein QVD17_33736 [Tagetes erecta]|uniref:Uncharacterized protein n=1 Tax=Tagetes erecta TaxID=13708 RepID=A0AAD8JXP8_TARER|nr:hypothetical protein QVD17_33736 [Tagetes erecta]